VKLVETQRRRRAWRGFIVKSPSCTTAILTLTLKPLLDEPDLRRVLVSTLQAISGASLEGLCAMRIHDNVAPYVEGKRRRWQENSLRCSGSSRGIA